MEIVKDEEVKKGTIPKVAEYDPNKGYKWEPTDTFVLTGNDFGIVLNALRAVISMPVGLTTLKMAERASQAIENSLKAAVEVGIVKEAPLEEKPKSK